MTTARIIQCARGEVPADRVLTGGRIVNVFTGEIVSGDIAIADGRIVGIGPYRAAETVDLGGRYVCPAFIDAHVHIESSMTAIPGFVRTVLPRGVATAVADPHEIANVLGVEGIRYMLAASDGQPMNLFFTLPSCVPATEMETAGAELSAETLLPLFGEPRIVALGEMMNVPGVLTGAPDSLRKIEGARCRRRPVDGHSPGLTGSDLNAYLAAGAASDHECTTPREALEKLGAGMYIMIREGTGARNLDDLLPIVTERNHHRMMWCTDDRHPHDLLAHGSIDDLVRRSIAAGLDPILAIRMATLNPAAYFGLDHLGAVAPGRQADLVVFSDLGAPRAEMVFTQGVQRAANGEMMDAETPPLSGSPPSVMAVPMDRVDLRVRAEGERIRVIDVVPDQLITRQSVERVPRSGGLAVADVSRDLLKIAVVERYTGRGGTGNGFVRGFHLARGAMASSVAHDSHNLIVVGTNDADMRRALAAVVDMKGGLAVACDGGGETGLLETLPLPVGGLMSDASMDSVRRRMDRLNRAAHGLGCRMADPFMTLSFLALPVIPSLKITDKGLVDVDRFQSVPLFVD